APARERPGRAEMKMWSISVEPIPSRTSTLVRSRHDVYTDGGRVSPALIASLRKEVADFNSGTCFIIRRKLIGTQKAIVTLCLCRHSTNAGGENRSRRTVDAPNRSGNNRRSPRPYANASVGCPPKRSDGVGLRM